MRDCTSKRDKISEGSGYEISPGSEPKLIIIIYQILNIVMKWINPEDVCKLPKIYIIKNEQTKQRLSDNINIRKARFWLRPARKKPANAKHPSYFEHEMTLSNTVRLQSKDGGRVEAANEYSTKCRRIARHFARFKQVGGRNEDQG